MDVIKLRKEQISIILVFTSQTTKQQGIFWAALIIFTVMILTFSDMIRKLFLPYFQQQKNNSAYLFCLTNFNFPRNRDDLSEWFSNSSWSWFPELWRSAFFSETIIHENFHNFYVKRAKKPYMISKHYTVVSPNVAAINASLQR